MDIVNTTDVKLLVDLVTGLEADATDQEVDLGIDLICWTMLEDVNRTLSSVRRILANRLGEAMPEKRFTVMGVGTFERHGRKDRTQWDKDALLRAVLDTRLVNPDTGEILDPNAIDKLLHVWNLGTPRTTALRARGLDPDEFCHAEWAGWSLELKA